MPDHDWICSVQRVPSSESGRRDLGLLRKLGCAACSLGDARDMGTDAMVANGESGFIWTEEPLVQYVAIPDELIPEIRMELDGLEDAQERRDIAAHIATRRPAQFCEHSKLRPVFAGRLSGTAWRLPVKLM